MRKETIKSAQPQANPGYAMFQIAKALTTAQEHEDPETRARAHQKIARWEAVLQGMLDGTLDVGSRTPMQGVPGWVTLEVVTGGFVTGNKLAGGPLLDHERELLATLPDAPEQDARRTLNAHFLTDQGLADLQDRLRTGHYDVGVPEEGALLVVAWLVSRDQGEQARNLLEELGPFLTELRFYPRLIDRPQPSGSQVFLQTVGETISNLNAISPNDQILKQKEAVQIWTPLYDQMIGLFLETVEGEPPFLRREDNGQRARPPLHGLFPIEGGWPCRRYPEGWHQRAQLLLDTIARQRNDHTLCRRPEKSKSTFAQLRALLSRCRSDPASLTGRDVGRVRLILAGYVDKRGVPGSATCTAVRERQIQHAAAPTFHDISRVLLARLAGYPTDTGMEDLDRVVQPITSNEAEQLAMPAGTPVPGCLQTKVQRCLSGSVDVLVGRGIITSGEVLARVLPQITSNLRAAAIDDPELRQLYAAIYRAFRRRRSLLLLNMESQIRMEELPWVAAIDRFRTHNVSASEQARQALEEVALLTLRSFPHAILPNKLIQEMRALARTAHLKLPLVEELAADIFMGEFAGNYVEAAKQAADLMEGTLYERYYAVDYQRVREIPAPVAPKGIRAWFERKAPDAFAELCAEMAGVTYQPWKPAISGMIIEQQQIITTQNLAVVFAGLNLRERMSPLLSGLAEECFAWICRRQQMRAVEWHATLIMLKNTAYAWRQMVFYLALVPPERVDAFIAWAKEHLYKQNESYRARFLPALRGLTMAAEGRTLKPSTETPQARRFLGWSSQRHWLLDDGQR